MRNWYLADMQAQDRVLNGGGGGGSKLVEDTQPGMRQQQVGDPEYAHRRPFIYHQPTDTVYLGGPGAGHDEIQAKQGVAPNMPGQYHGYIMQGLEGWPDEATFFSDEHNQQFPHVPQMLGEHVGLGNPQLVATPGQPQEQQPWDFTASLLDEEEPPRLDDDEWAAQFADEMARGMDMSPEAIHDKVGVGWQVGANGKGYELPDGTRVEWTVDHTGAPHHQQVLTTIGHPQRGTEFYHVTPGGVRIPDKDMIAGIYPDAEPAWDF